jgi:hypothetical protein
MALIDAALAKKHLKVDSTHEDDLILLYTGAAESCAMEFLNRKIYADDAELAAAITAGTAGVNPMVINDQIKVAILIILAGMQVNRSDTVVGAVVAELPRNAESFLWPFRTGLGV